ncbi:MAG TPA: DegQ family serine endoprotease [Rhabdochlamydiaceae bacterium]|nr:DegQ family serine endoprotease [Rhabdochlamydiaceae bacterium]
MRSLIALTSILLATAAPVYSSKDKVTAAVVPQTANKSFSTVAKKAIPAVVFIKVTGMTDEEGAAIESYQNPFDFFGDDFFNKFFGAAPRGKMPKQPQLSQGSGFIVSPDGYIMTNAHVIKGADKITVILNNGKEMNATLVGMDSHTDIAIIKIEGKDLPHIALGDSDAMEIGEWVVAIGSPFQLEASLTVGVVSAKGRQNLKITDLEDFIQTDAAINPGNSGGPLLNLDSEVIGINTAIVSRTGGYMGIGFAVPSNMAKHVMAQIIDKGSVTRGFLGVSLQPVDKDIADAFNLDKPEGALVSEVVKDSPADKAGLQQGDIIVEYNGISVKTLGSFRNDISLMSPGARVTLKVNRKGKLVTIPVVLGSASDSFSSDGAMQKMGLEVDNLTPDLAKQLGYVKGEEGVVITKIKPGSPAAVAGMRPGFLIMAINHKKVTNTDDFNEAIKDSENKKRVLILARQGNVTRFYSLKME